MQKRYMWSISIQTVVQVLCGCDNMGKWTVIREKHQLSGEKTKMLIIKGKGEIVKKEKLLE